MGAFWRDVGKASKSSRVRYPSPLLLILEGQDGGRCSHQTSTGFAAHFGCVTTRIHVGRSGSIGQLLAQLNKSARWHVFLLDSVQVRIYPESQARDAVQKVRARLNTGNTSLNDDLSSAISL